MTLRSIDLKKVNDHPATLLERAFPQPPSPTNDDGPDIASFVGASIGAHWVGKAVSELRQYEDTNNVTFAALDNDALWDVREAYDRLTGGFVKDIKKAQVIDLLTAIDLLLGLDT